MSTKPMVGQGIDRLDANKKVTGTATYAADTDVTKVAHAVILSATIAKGSITGIDLVAARHQPGVLAVLSHLDAPRVMAGKSQKSGPGERVCSCCKPTRSRTAINRSRSSSRTR